MRLLCLTVKPDGGVMTPTLTRLGFAPYTFCTVFQGTNIRHHPAEWEALLLGKKALQDIKFLKDYDCLVGAPSTVMYQHIMDFCPPYTKVILVVERDKMGWATAYEQFLQDFLANQSSVSKGRHTHVGRVQEQFYSLVDHMTVGSRMGSLLSQNVSHECGEEREVVGGVSPGRLLSPSPSADLPSLILSRAQSLEKFEQRVMRTVHHHRLLVYDLSHGWEPLHKFLGVEKKISSIPSLTVSSEAESTKSPNDIHGLNVLHILEDRFARVALLYRLVKLFLVLSIFLIFQSYFVTLWKWAYLTYEEYKEACATSDNHCSSIKGKK